MPWGHLSNHVIMLQTLGFVSKVRITLGVGRNDAMV